MSDLAVRARELADASEAASAGAREQAGRHERWHLGPLPEGVCNSSNVGVAMAHDRWGSCADTFHIAHHDPATMAEIRATLRALADEVERLRGDVVWHTTARAGMEAELARLRPVVEAARVVYAMRALRGGNSLPNAIDRLGAALKEHDDA